MGRWGEMANGKPGDHPFTDIVVHGRDVYSPNVARLVREISQLADEEVCGELADLLFFEFKEWLDPDIEKLERILTDMRERLLSDAGKRESEA